LPPQICLARLAPKIVAKMSSEQIERRRRRSSDPQEALGYWLEATRRRTRLSSLALADDHGMLVAGAGPASECDEIAAWAPIVLSGLPADSAPPFELHGARVSGFDAFVCARSAETEISSLVDAARGCSRILHGRASGNAITEA